MFKHVLWAAVWNIALNVDGHSSSYFIVAVHVAIFITRFFSFFKLDKQVVCGRRMEPFRSVSLLLLHLSSSLVKFDAARWIQSVRLAQELSIHIVDQKSSRRLGLFHSLQIRDAVSCQERVGPEALLVVSSPDVLACFKISNPFT